jgi:hypothetical protein
MYILEKGLSYQKLILVVQEKPDYPVFAGLNPLTELPRSPFFSLLSLFLSRTTMRVTPRPPLEIPLFLRGILEFLGEINFPRTDVSTFPTGFSHLKVFLPNH